MLVLSAGMPRAGSGWFYNLTHDLLLANGAQDARRIRKQFHLQAILTEVNCNIRTLSPPRLLAVMVPVALGNTFVVKTHSAPTPLAEKFIRLGWMQALYIHRDPRDALLSAYEAGQRGSKGFAHLQTIEQAIEFMQLYVDIGKAWLQCPEALVVRYEDLKGDYWRATKKMLDFLSLPASNPNVAEVLERYRPDRGSVERKGLHFHKGQIGRHRRRLTSRQQETCRSTFSWFLEHGGYPL